MSTLKDDIENGKILTVTWWGNPKNYGSPSEHLIKAADPKFCSQIHCKTRFRESYRNLGQDLICGAIGTPNDKKNGDKIADACQIKVSKFVL
jgi:hypothetical protein